MRIITFRVGGSGTFFAPLAILTALLAHICCILPLLISLGIGSAGRLLADVVDGSKPWLILTAFIFLSYTGWKTYRNPRATRLEKVILWISVATVILIISM